MPSLCPAAKGGRPAAWPRVHGFTLIELLVLVLVVAVVSGAAVLALSGAGGTRELEREARRLAALGEYACEQALFLGLDVGLHLGAQGYWFSAFDGELWAPFGPGTPIRARSFAAAIPGPLRLQEQHMDLLREPPEEPQVICLASGELTPFELDLSLANETWLLSGDWRGRISVLRTQG